MPREIDDPNNFSHEVETQLDKIEDELEEEEAKDIIRWATEELREGNLSASTLSKAYLPKLRKISRFVDTSLRSGNQISLMNSIARLSNNSNWSDGTQRNYEKGLKRYRGYYDEAVDEISLTGVDRISRIEEDDSISRDDFEALVQECRNTRDTAILWLLYDSGIRVSFLCSLRVKDYESKSDGTGRLKPNRDAEGLKEFDEPVPTLVSTGFIDKYLATDHPRPDDREAPLFHKLGTQWNGEGNGVLYPSRVRTKLKRIAERAGVDKEIAKPHSFRHAAVKRWKQRGMSEQEIKHRAGWSEDSTQLKRYGDADAEELNKSIIERHGINSDMDSEMPDINNCPRCGLAVEDTWNSCPRCGATLKIGDELWLKLYLEFADEKDRLAAYWRNYGDAPKSLTALSPRDYWRVRFTIEANVQLYGQRPEAYHEEGYSVPIDPDEDNLMELLSSLFESHDPDDPGVDGDLPWEHIKSHESEYIREGLIEDIDEVNDLDDMNLPDFDYEEDIIAKGIPERVDWDLLI